MKELRYEGLARYAAPIWLKTRILTFIVRDNLSVAGPVGKANHCSRLAVKADACYFRRVSRSKRYGFSRARDWQGE